MDATFAPGLLASTPAAALNVLSRREHEVLSLVAEGRTNAAIATTLFLSLKTVEAHVASTFTKLGIVGVPHANRRVLAVLTYLSASGATPVPSG